MRKVSLSSRKIKKFLEKSVFHFDSGFKRSVNFELDGQRFLGQKMDYLTVSDESISFGYDGKDFSCKLGEIKSYKRLRTKKYLFFISKAKEEAKPKKEKKEKKEKLVDKIFKTKDKE